MDGISIDVACILFIPNNPDYLQSQCGRKIKSAKSSVIKVYEEIKVEKSSKKVDDVVWGSDSSESEASSSEYESSDEYDESEES